MVSAIVVVIVEVVVLFVVGIVVLGLLVVIVEEDEEICEVVVEGVEVEVDDDVGVVNVVLVDAIKN